MKRYLGLICLLYSGIIIYVWISNTLKNFLAPSMQIYLKISVFLLIIMALVLLFNNKIEYKFKISDLILLLPLILLILAGDGRLTTNFASNRKMNYNTQIKQEKTNTTKNEEQKQEEEQEIETKKEITSIDVDVKDSSYSELGTYLSFGPKASNYVDKTIRVKGFVLLDDNVIPNGYFAIGKYNISCCAADAEFVGFYVKKENYEVKNNSWYQIEGYLEYFKGIEGNDAVAIRIVNLKEIDANSEEQYVYPCYSYDNGSCAEVSKYDLSYE